MRIFLIICSCIAFVCLGRIIYVMGYTHNGPAKHEKGIVIEKQFSPEFNASGTGVGLSGSGHMVVTTNNMHKEEEFLVVFRCEHKTVFSINRKDLFTNLEKNDSVDIEYCDVFNCRNELVDLEFITATKK